MVFFQCSGCGTDCKKNQVEKHKTNCRKSDIFSCLDCSIEFRGSLYSSHTKCISESAKYEAKNSATNFGQQSKGDVKQEAWLNKINRALQESSIQPNSNQVTKIIERLPDYPNIPRKKAKLINFLKSSLRVIDVSVCEAVWNFLDNAKDEAAAVEKVEEVTKELGNDHVSSPTPLVTTPDSAQNDECTKDLAEDKESVKTGEKRKRDSSGNFSDRKKKKKTKRKDGVTEQPLHVVENGVQKVKKKKKLKKLANELSNQENGKTKEETSVENVGIITISPVIKNIKKSKKKKTNKKGTPSPPQVQEFLDATINESKIEVIPESSKRNYNEENVEIPQVPQKNNNNKNKNGGNEIIVDIPNEIEAAGKKKKRKAKTDFTTEPASKKVHKKLSTAAIQVSEIPASKEERKLQKKMIRKKRREELKCQGLSLPKERNKKEALTTVNGSSESTKRVSFSPEVQDNSLKGKKKGKRFDIGRVIHAFLDSCPSKEAAFAQVVSKVLEELSSVDTKSSMSEDHLKKKIMNKVQFNPHIKIQDGNVTLV